MKILYKRVYLTCFIQTSKKGAIIPNQLSTVIVTNKIIVCAIDKLSKYNIDDKLKGII